VLLAGVIGDVVDAGRGWTPAPARVRGDRGVDDHANAGARRRGVDVDPRRCGVEWRGVDR
jgi:hypothetical protein